MGKLAVAPVWKWPCWGLADIRFITRQIGDFDSAKAVLQVPSHYFWKNARFLLAAGVRWPYTYLVGCWSLLGKGQIMDLKAEYLMLRRITGQPAARVWRVVRLCAERGQLDRALWYLVNSR